MTDKEQIIINGVDVRECEYLTYQLEEDGEYYWFCNIAPAGGPDECECKPECIYKRVLKQLARKEQEINNVHEYYKELRSNATELANKYVQLRRQLKEKEQECEELKTENEELNNRMAEVTYRATGGRLSYSNYTLDAIEEAFNDQLEILSDHKVEKETKELNQKLYLAQNEIRSKTEYIQEQRDIIKKLEQECEELKEYARRQENQRETYYKEFLKTNKALDEIKDLLFQVTNVDFPKDDYITPAYKDVQTYYRNLQKQILNIINKAKGKANE